MGGEVWMRSWGAKLRCVCCRDPTETAREVGAEEATGLYVRLGL